MIPFYRPETLSFYQNQLVDRIQDYMEDMTWTSTMSRPSVSGYSHHSSGMRRGNSCQSMVFGMTRRLGHLLQPATNNLKHERLYHLLCQLRDTIPNTSDLLSITVNKNLQCLEHKDGNDERYNSVIIGCGDYQGGQLGVRAGNGRVYQYDINRKPLHFNGSLLEHWTLPFSGNRYTIVFYKKKAFAHDPS